MSNSKCRKLFLSRPNRHVCFTFIFMILGLLTRTMEATGQPDQLPPYGTSGAARLRDSIPDTYDSLQDLRMERLQRQYLNRIRSLESEQERALTEMDSLTGLLRGLNAKVRQLGKIEKEQGDSISRLRKELNLAMDTAHQYRQGLNRFLWVSGTLILMLIFATFVFFLLRSGHTRRMIEKLRVRQQKLRMKLRSLKGEVTRNRKDVRSRFKQERLDLEDKLKKQRKSILKSIRKRIRKRS